VTRVVLALLAALALASCGGDDDPGSGDAPRPVDLALDFTPNPVHAPVFAAARTGADRDNGVRLRIREPGEGPNALKLVASGRALLGLLDIHDLAIAREQGVDVVAVAALVQKPLAALLTDPSVRRPRDLAGRTVGVSGLPSDPAFVRAIVEHDGGEYDRIEQVTIGFKAVSALLSRRVDAVPAFWNAEGVALEERGRKVRQFRVEDYGAPAYPEVVVIASRRALRERRADIAAAVRAIAAGVEAVEDDPGAAVSELARASAADESLVRAQLDAVLPLFRPAVRLDRAVLEDWARFDEEVGIVERRPDVGAAFDFRISGGAPGS
jgi:NitT/TauT family transport system substrate-binding protein/putative hydroxymethylpyrimidine transport system substrate-binding protein